MYCETRETFEKQTIPIGNGVRFIKCVPPFLGADQFHNFYHEQK